MSPDVEDRDEIAPVPEAPAETGSEPPIAEDEAVELTLDAAPVVSQIEPESFEPEPEGVVQPEPEPTPGPPVEPEAPPLAAFAGEIREAVAKLGEDLGKKLAGLQGQFDREVRAEANRERIVDRLHAELQEYKQDLLMKMQRPIFVDLIQLHDDVGKMAAALAPEAHDFRGTLESIQTALEDVMFRQGVEPFRAEGDVFDPRRQRAVTTVSTPDPGLAKTIAARIRPGFQAGEKVVRPEVVSVYTFKAD
ncbi:nucleotide exchange factor GrpE [Paludisphaera rhizosphaerae]|uniref:nucleotide exchange factor GrpE n=1 Tax=Paludisphaera rhizosphaerae TaxID=2711216 RepID=UPI001F0F5847|nr:nucleotide exchange factor GrpE [Paludisphaera rhizosphaerae]